jgi:hypothetical protein
MSKKNTDASQHIKDATDDEEFNFTYNLSDINKLVFSVNSLLGTNSLESPILINPSVNSSSNQNVINLKYKKPLDSVTNITAIITKLNICHNFFVKGSYLIVLSGNIINNSTNQNLYIAIPFTLGGLDNTPSSVEITKILKAAQTQIAYGSIDGIILTTNLVMNTLIDPNSQYLKGQADKYSFQKSPFHSYYEDDLCVFIYKTTVNKVSSDYDELLKHLNSKDGTTSINYITDIILYKNPNISPGLNKTQATGEIMIDCSPIEITTNTDNTDNVMFKTDNKNIMSSESAINSIFLLLFTFIICYILYKIFKTIWVIFIKKQNLDSQ